jgi:hypothetical protein
MVAYDDMNYRTVYANGRQAVEMKLFIKALSFDFHL